MSETNLLRRVLLNLTSKVKTTRLFRNNVGQGWQGSCVKVEGKKVTIHDARPLQAGLCPGSSDLIGWTSVKITPDMVGLDFAIFTAVEVKTPSGRSSEKQRNFLRVVREAGGFAHLVKSEDEAVNLLSKTPIEQTIR